VRKPLKRQSSFENINYLVFHSHSNLVAIPSSMVASDQFEPVSVCRKMREPMLKKLAPLGESDGSVELEIVSAVVSAFLIEVVMDGAVNGYEFLQTSHLSETEHGSFTSSKWLVRILGTVIEPAARFLPFLVTDDFHRGAIGTQLIRHDGMRVPIALHCFPRNFNAVLRSRRFVT
jgi:hypothetical protein